MTATGAIRARARQAISRRVGRLLGRLGWRLSRWPAEVPPGPSRTPVGELRSFLEGLAGRGFSPRHVLDVGAHRGAWSRVARAAFPAARFTLIEPQAELGAELERFCAETPGSRWVAAGAAATPGELPLTVFAARDRSSFLPGGGEAGGVETRPVEVLSVDSLFAGAGDADLPELVKIDAEGFELEVLAGAGRLLGRTELFVVEAALFRFRPGQPTLAELVGWMAARGYEPYDFPWFLRRPIDGALGLVDVAFARRDGLLRADRRWD